MIDSVAGKREDEVRQSGSVTCEVRKRVSKRACRSQSSESTWRGTEWHNNSSCTWIERSRELNRRATICCPAERASAPSRFSEQRSHRTLYILLYSSRESSRTPSVSGARAGPRAARGREESEEDRAHLLEDALALLVLLRRVWRDKLSGTYLGQRERSYERKAQGQPKLTYFHPSSVEHPLQCMAVN